MLAPFFAYLLECTHSSDFQGKVGSVDSMASLVDRTIVPSGYVKVSNLPFGFISEKDQRRYAGTIISLKRASVAGYPFPARVISITYGCVINVCWDSITGNTFSAHLDPDDEIKIEVIKDRSPEAIILRESEKRLTLRRQIQESSIIREKKHRQFKVNSKRLASKLFNAGISNQLYGEQIIFCDGLYLIDYSDESEEFEIVNAGGVFISRFSNDERGISKLVSTARRLDDSYNPEEHIERLTGISA
jgi:hypothetical protein